MAHAVSMVTCSGAPKSSHIFPILKSFHWLKINMNVLNTNFFLLRIKLGLYHNHSTYLSYQLDLCSTFLQQAYSLFICYCYQSLCLDHQPAPIQIKNYKPFISLCFATFGTNFLSSFVSLTFQMSHILPRLMSFHLSHLHHYPHHHLLLRRSSTIQKYSNQ